MMMSTFAKLVDQLAMFDIVAFHYLFAFAVMWVLQWALGIHSGEETVYKQWNADMLFHEIFEPRESNMRLKSKIVRVRAVG